MDERDALRQRANDILKRVPAYINSASVQQVIAFKKMHADALKLVNKTNASKPALQSLCNQLNATYGIF